MSDFYQDGTISTLHDFGTKSTKDLEKDLLNFSKERKMELILPCLYSELKGDALPKIVNEISKQMKHERINEFLKNTPPEAGVGGGRTPS